MFTALGSAVKSQRGGKTELKASVFIFFLVKTKLPIPLHTHTHTHTQCETVYVQFLLLEVRHRTSKCGIY